jgi:hypothetical protein
MITQLHVKFFFFKKKYSISKQLNSIIIMKEMFNDFVVIQILEN